MEENNSNVLEFFNRGRVFLTGGTGFVGKIILDKLLRVMHSQVDQVYLLVRSKKGKDSVTRMKELFDDPVFDRLKNERPAFRNKVKIISGDCSLLELGLDENDKNLLIDNVTHVFHAAATVRFDEKLKLAVAINVQGVLEVIKLCKEMKHLKSVVHVSTAYANCPQEVILEEFYEPPISGQNAIKLVQALDENRIDRITPGLITPWPNTYSFTKAIAESIVREEAKKLPLAVFRPSIVIGTKKEPVPGWIDNLYGPTGVIVGVGAGLLRVMFADRHQIADLVPVDLVVNSLFCVAWDVGTKHKPNNNIPDEEIVPTESTEKTEPPIYNFTAAKCNPLTWREFLDYNLIPGKNTPTIRAIWYYTILLTKIRWLHKILIFFLHIIPAIIMDAGLFIAGKKPQMLQAYSKIHKFQEVIAFFSTRRWNFGESNTADLWNRLNATDKELFNYDMKTLDWKLFFKNYVYGIRIYLFHETPDTLPAARKRMQLLHIAHRALQFVFLVFCYWIISSIISLFVPSVGSQLSAIAY